MKLALCSFVRDERDLAEWVAHHLAVGFEHVFLYDNQSVVPVREVLAAAVAEGSVTAIDWPGGTRQLSAFDDGIRRFGPQARWLAFFDADEYLVPKRGVSEWLALLDRAQHRGAGALQICWRMFGSSGRLERPSGGELVVEAYDRRVPDDYKPNGHTKAVVQTHAALGAGPDPHHFRLVHGVGAVTETLQVQLGPMTPGAPSYDFAALHHYFTKSRADYAEKVARGRPDVAGARRGWAEFEDLETWATVEDRSACEWAEATRATLARWAAAT